MTEEAKVEVGTKVYHEYWGNGVIIEAKENAPAREYMQAKYGAGMYVQFGDPEVVDLFGNGPILVANIRYYSLPELRVMAAWRGARDAADEIRGGS